MARRRRARYRAWTVCVCLLAAAGCNSPYPDSDKEANTVYTTFSGDIGRMDPAQAYGGTRYTLICNILEPPLQYHFLKRPYELIPLSAAEVPKAEKRTIAREDDPTKTREVIVYKVRIRKGIRYQNHQCFFEPNRRLTEADMRGVRRLADLKDMGTRELVAKDFVFAIRRLADPRQISAVLTTLEQTVLGMAEYSDAFQKELDRQRELRRQEGGPGYSQLKGERTNPIRIDVWAWDLPGVKQTGKYEFEIILKQPYPQILYWLAMPFFAPVPHEAIEFYDQRLVLERGLLFYNDAIGTGPYKLAELDPTNQLVIVRNENFREDYYPSLPEPAPDDAQAVANYQLMKAKGMLDDAGKRLPMADRFVFRMEREWIPRWNKFLQGYYDWSSIESDAFDTAISLTSEGDPTLSPEMRDRGIQLQTAPAASINFYAFNMQDPVVGGYSPEQRKLRQAITIAFDTEEFITIFASNQARPAHSPTPPGIFGYEGGKVGMNPVAYHWDEQLGRPVRRSLDEARKLLAEAGYPGGVGADGKRLVIRFDNAWASASQRPMLKFVAKQFDKLGIRLDIETITDNTYWQKITEGHYQFLALGWRADYPDIENFHFMLYGENARYRGGTENNANYYNPEFDKLFEQARHMENGPERLRVIRRMNRVIQEDAPWLFGYHRVAFSLVHGWCKNSYPSDIVLNNLKYRRVDFQTRTARRREWNRPRWVPIAVFLALLVVGIVPAIRGGVRRMREA